MSPELRLLYSTNIPHIDRVLHGLVGLTELVLPGVVRSYYLKGSYVEGTAIPASDLDLTIVLKRGSPPGHVEGLRQLYRHCDRISAVPIDVFVCDESAGYLLAEGGVRYGRLLYGTDLQNALVDLLPADFNRRFLHGASRVATRCYPPGELLRYPLSAPDPTNPWLGFACRRVRRPDGREEPGLQELVNLTHWLAKALIIRTGGRYFYGKGAMVEASCREAVGEEWGELVAVVYRRCRQDWGYGIPAEEAERQELRRLCERVVAFINHYLGVYRGFLVEE